MIQFKHIQMVTFEGYAGHEPEWNKMLEQERVLASIDILEELAMDLSNGAIAGEFGNKLKSEFEMEFRGRAEDFPPSQIAKWLGNGQKNLFIGKFNFCFFDPGKAHCTTDSSKDNPILNSCDPTRCSNACVSRRHACMWEAQLQQAEEFVNHPKATEYQRQALSEEITHLRIVVNSIR